MTDPDLPRDPGTAGADSPPGGGRRPYTWVLGLLLVLAVIGVVAVLLGLADGGIGSR